ncbi:MAG: hypothetical protein AB7O96_10460 [Pseudobdellovibrionaceae bacterium]
MKLITTLVLSAVLFGSLFTQAGIFSRKKPPTPTPVTAVKSDFIAGIDSQISGSIEGRSLMAARYHRLFARLSVYALYCYQIMGRGMNTEFSNMRLSAPKLEKEVVKYYGGIAKWDTKFDRARGEESNRFVADENRGQTCTNAYNTFYKWIGMSGSALEVTLLAEPYGQL